MITYEIIYKNRGIEIISHIHAHNILDAIFKLYAEQNFCEILEIRILKKPY